MCTHTRNRHKLRTEYSKNRSQNNRVYCYILDNKISGVRRYHAIFRPLQLYQGLGFKVENVIILATLTSILGVVASTSDLRGMYIPAGNSLHCCVRSCAGHVATADDAAAGDAAAIRHAGYGGGAGPAAVGSSHSHNLVHRQTKYTM